MKEKNPDLQACMKSSLGSDIYNAIACDDVELWQQLIITTCIEDEPDKVKKVANVASLFGSEKIWKTIIIKWPNFAEDKECMRNIIISGNIGLIRMMPVLPDAPSIALSCLRPCLAQWFLNNEKCSLPIFKEIKNCFAVNVLCSLSHHPGYHIYQKSLSCPFSCFAKINIMNSNALLSFAGCIKFKNEECVKIAFDHKYSMGDESLKHCLYYHKDVAIAREILKYDFVIRNDNNRNLPMAALIYDLDPTLYIALIKHGANIDNPFIQSMIMDFPKDYNWGFDRSFNDSYSYKDNIWYFFHRYGRKYNIKLLEKVLKRASTKLTLPNKPRYSGIRQMPFAIYYFNSSDANLFKYNMYQTFQYSLDSYHHYYGNNKKFIIFIISSNSITQLLEGLIPPVTLIIYYGKYNDCEKFAELENYARNNSSRLLIMDDSIDEELFNEVIREATSIKERIFFI